jgi:hypothetical protein
MRVTAFSRFTLGLLVLTIAFAPNLLQADEATSTDDGWRRTARGWERTAAWTEPDMSSEPAHFHISNDPPEPAQRWDVHPLLLVAAQVLLVTGAFCLWPRLGAKRATWSANKGKVDAIDRQVRPRNVA